jgi:hypothetical protein
MAKTDTDTGELAHAVGTELQTHREQRGWSRPAVAACSDGNVSTKGLQSMEKATRSVSIRQLDLAGHLYAIRPSELLLRAERKLSWEPAGVAVDLDILTECRHEALRPAAQWACQERDTGSLTVRLLAPVELASLAQRCRLDTAELTMLLTTQAPVTR